MKIISISTITVLLVALVVSTAAAQRTTRIATSRGVVNIEISGDRLELGDVLSSMRARIDSLRALVRAEPGCAARLLPILVEISVMLEMFPPDIYGHAVEVDTAVPMDDETFAQYLQSIKEQTFSDEKLEYLRITSKKNYFTCQQLGQILDLFDFSDDKLEAVRILKPRIVDPENAFLIRDKFTFDSDKQKFLDIMYSE